MKNKKTLKILPKSIFMFLISIAKIITSSLLVNHMTYYAYNVIDTNNICTAPHMYNK